MICPRCKATIADDAAFCGYCGAGVRNTGAGMQAPGAAGQNAGTQAPGMAGQNAGMQPGSVKAPKKNAKKGGSKVGLIVGIIAAVVVVVAAVAVAAVVLLTKKTTVNLNDYLTVTISEGYDTLGSAYSTFEEEQFILDYADKIKLTSAGEAVYGAYVGTYLYPDAATLLAYELLNPGGHLSSTSELSNGDTVTFTWDIDEELIEEYFNVKVECSSITQTVSGLAEIEEVDVFEYVTVVFEGVSPDGTARVQVTGGDYTESDFDLSNDSGLSDGDVVTVTFSSGSAATMQYSGKTPAEMSKTYTVELAKYVTSLSEVTDEFVTEYEDEISSIFEDERSEWDDRVTFQSMSYVTDYLLTSNYDDYEEYELYLVYEISVDQDGTELTYYWYIGFYDVTVGTDGTYNVNFDYISIPGYFYDGIEFQYITYNSENGALDMTYSGYLSMGTLYEELIAGDDSIGYEGTEYTEEDTDIPLDAIEYNGHYYKIFDEEDTTWEEAKAACEEMGGHLLTITSQEEQEFVEAVEDALYLEECWIGCYLGSDSAWHWVTDETWSYENWMDGEPSGDDEEYGCTWSEGEWNDLAEYWDLSVYICEWE